MHHDEVGQRCPRCRATFRVLADEYGMHECPRCGYHPSTHPDEDEPDETVRPKRPLWGRP